MSSPTEPMPDNPQDAYRKGWASASRWGAADRMNELETLMWRSERHPRQSSTITMLMLLDRAPDWARLRAALDWGSRLVPLMRKRVVEPVLPVGPPAWAPDPTFNLDYHLRRVHLPAPGGHAELLALTQAAALAPFDRVRPLWEATLVEGLADDRAAYILKLHHSLTDGRGVIQILSLLQSPTRAHTPKGPMPELPEAQGQSDRVGLALDEVGDRLRSAPAYATRLASAELRALARPAESVVSALRYVGSMRRTLIPSAGGSPLLRDRAGTDWRFGTFECDFVDLRAAAKAAAGSVNDAYVAVLLGGLRRYHENFGVKLDAMPMAMPVSVRKEDDPMGGNKFAGTMFSAPIGIVDPAERIAAVRGTVLALRVEPAVDSFSFVGPALNLLPSEVGARVLRAGAAADVSASNVPGVSRPTYLAGALVERVYGFGPLPGVAVMATMNTTAGQACFGLNCDGRAVKDVPLLMECMRDGLAEVLALGAAKPTDAAATKPRAKRTTKSAAKRATRKTTSKRPPTTGE
ncbi:wax ester/triacylglycerol synthase domain-containing protein [Leekyejoonella antrihumi]|uniref:diacylglycerol O-acyltransferase n=1 Tax=Leekyejoonella antrihumi TaxID=1660198 RepID=A0A563DYR3_9MICO|nr:wax ester/triacylglycerol synthase domain-containing protein [Leekyejoonella antrihumi]TWP35269.1 DUF1298 domain-containing protein [Leekyejoonella antrihumi]